MAILGSNFLIYAKIGAAGTKALVAGQRNGTISLTLDSVETTVKGALTDTNRFAKTYAGNLYGWEVSLSGVYDLTGGTVNLAAALMAGTIVTVTCDLGPEATNPDQATGDGIVTSFSTSGDQGDVVTYDITIQGTGGLTFAKATHQ